MDIIKTTGGLGNSYSPSQSTVSKTTLPLQSTSRVAETIFKQNDEEYEKTEKSTYLGGNIDHEELGKTIHGYEKIDKGTSKISIIAHLTLSRFCFFVPSIPYTQKQMEVLIKLIQTNQHIASLSISLFEIESNSMQLFAKFLKTNTTLTSISLGKNGLGEEGAKYIADALKVNKSIISLNLTRNAIGAVGVKCIVDALKVNSSLTFLYLSSNCISAVGAKYIAEALEKNTALTSLDLKSNSIGAVGVRYIAEALEKNTSITSLNLTGNAIGAVGVRYIAGALKAHNSIILLDLSQNVIGEGGAKCIAEALEKNTTLTSLDLSENPIGRKGVEYISNALRKNITLTSIGLLECQFNTETYSIFELVKRNKGHVYSLKKAVKKGNRSTAEKLIKTGISPLSSWKELQSLFRFKEFQSPFSFAVDKKNYPMIDLFLSKGFSLPDCPSTKDIRISVVNFPRFFKVIDAPFKAYNISPDLVDIILSYSFDTSSHRRYAVEIREKVDEFLSISLE